MKTMNRLAVISIISLVAPAANANLVIRLNPSYLPAGGQDGEVNNPNQGDERSTWTLTHRLDAGWKFHLGDLTIPLGGSWLYSKTKLETTPFDGSGATVQRQTTTSIGIWTGLEFGNFDLDFIYYLSPSQKFEETGKAAIELTEGTGWELGLGYLVPVSGSISIGPRYVYRSLSWDGQTSGGTAGTYDIRPEKSTESQFLLGIEIDLGGRGRGGRF